MVARRRDWPCAVATASHARPSRPSFRCGRHDTSARRVPLIALLVALALVAAPALARHAPTQPRQQQHIFQVQHASGAEAGVTPPHGEANAPPRTSAALRRAHKVAIIGSGPGGSSAAYYLSRAQQILESQGRGEEGFEVTVLERNHRVGGRAHAVPVYDQAGREEVELGASIFAGANRNLIRAAEEFGLPTDAKLGESGDIGIWDGQQFQIEGNEDSWWTSAKFLWRYGTSLSTANKIVKKIVDSYVRLYDPTFLHQPAETAEEGQDQGQGAKTMEATPSSGTKSGFPWRSVEEISETLGFRELAASKAGDYFYDHGVAKLFVEEILESLTMVNYGQDVYTIDAMGGSLCMATSGARGVRGGNRRIFEEMVGRSGARLRMGETGEVTGLVKFASVRQALEEGRITEEQAQEEEARLARRGGLASVKRSAHDAGDRELRLTATTATTTNGSAQWWVGTKSGWGELFDHVLVATPWHNAGITLMNTHATIPTPRYVRLHVTLLVTNASQPSARYFGRREGESVPRTVLVTMEAARRATEGAAVARARASAGREKRGGLVGKMWPWGGDDDDGEKPPRRPEFNSLNYLAKLNATEEGGPEEHVVKIFSPESLSDAKLEEIMGASTIKWVHRQEWDAYPYLLPTTEFPKLVPDSGLYFLNSFERLISTMETSTVSARNAVALLLTEVLGSDFVHGRHASGGGGDGGDGDDPDRTRCPWEKPQDDGEALPRHRQRREGLAQRIWSWATARRPSGSKLETREGKGEDWAGWGCWSG